MAESRQDKFVKQIDFSAGNLAAKWKMFKDQFSVYQVVKGISKMETEDEKICHMLVSMGSEAVPIYNQFIFDDSDANKKKTLKNAIKFFDQYFEPVKNVIFERSIFNVMKQEPSESIHSFIVKLQTQSENCEYGTMRAEMVRDRIVVGVRDIELRKYLIDTDNLTLELCIQKAKQYVANQLQAEKMGSQTQSNASADEPSNIDVVFQEKKKAQKKSGDKSSMQDLTEQCKKCGKWKHFAGRCPAESSRCNRCKRIGHWGAMCLSKKKMEDKKISEVEEQDDILDSLYLGSD